MNEYFPGPKSWGQRVNVEVDLPNYATKTDLKTATCVDKWLPVPVHLSKLSDVVKMLLKKMYIMLRSNILKINYLILLT